MVVKMLTMSAVDFVLAGARPPRTATRPGDGIDPLLQSETRARAVPKTVDEQAGRGGKSGRYQDGAAIQIH